MKQHKIFAAGAMVCMCFSMLSGHKMIAGKQGLEKNKEKLNSVRAFMWDSIDALFCAFEGNVHECDFRTFCPEV